MEMAPYVREISSSHILQKPPKETFKDTPSFKRSLVSMKSLYEEQRL